MSKIEEIKERLSKATSGPWVSMDECGIYNDNVITIHNDSLTPVAAPPEAPEGDNWHADSYFIAYAPEDITYLLADVERLQAKLKQLMDASRNIEPLLPCTVVGRVRLKNLYDIAEFRGLLLQMEDEHE